MSTPPQSSGRNQTLAQASIDEVNRQRIRMGLTPLTPDPHLNRVALAHSMDMARRNFHSHINPDGIGPAQRIEAAGYENLANAENIARGYRDSSLVVNGWMDSPGHRANILNPDFRVIGAGYYVEPALPDGHFWTHLFAIPDRAHTEDKSRYPQQMFSLLNQERRSAGYVDLAGPPALQQAIMRHTATLAQRGPNGFAQDTNARVRAIAQDANYLYRHIIAHFVCGRGAGAPEPAYDQLLAGGLGRDLLGRTYDHAAVGYHFNREDSHRHYWLVLLAAPAA